MNNVNVSARRNLLSSISLSAISNHLKYSKNYTKLIVAPVVAGLLALPIIVPNQSFASTCASSGNWDDTGTISGNSCTLGNFNPKDNDGAMGNVGAYVINGNDTNGTVIINGNFNTVDKGINPSAGSIVPWSDIPDDALVNKDGSAAGQDGLNAWLNQIGGNTVKIINPGDRVETIVVDPITGGSKTISVYGGFNSVDTVTPVTGTVHTSEKGAFDEQYVPEHNYASEINVEENPGLTLGKVINGAKTDVQIQGDFEANAKFAHLFIGDGEGSEVNWNTGKVTNFNFTGQQLWPQFGKEDFEVKAKYTIGNFADNIPLPDGSVWKIKATTNDGKLDVAATQANIAAYNNHMVDLLLAGKTDWLLTQGQYDSYIDQVFKGVSETESESKIFTYDRKDDTSVFGENDDAWVISDGRNNFVLDLRNGATSIIGEDNSSVKAGMIVNNGIAIRAHDTETGFVIKNNAYVKSNFGKDNNGNQIEYATTYLRYGATGRNEGIIESNDTAVRIEGAGKNGGVNVGTDVNGQELKGEIFVNSKGAVINAGNGGIIANMQSWSNGDITNYGTVNAGGVGIQVAEGFNTNLENHGVVNAGRTGLYKYNYTGFGNLINTNIVNAETGMLIAGAGYNTAENTGAINARVYGVNINAANSTFNNKEGEIYIGREGQSSLGQAVNDIKQSSAYGVFVEAGSAINDGTITLGSQVENSSAMFLKASDDLGIVGTITNKSEIILKGGWDYAGGTNLPYGMNVGINVVGNGDSTSNRKATNDGVIRLEGSNSVGVLVQGVDISNNAYSQGAYANLTENSKVYVGAGYRDEDKGIFFRNYGVYADGDYAKADVNGLIDLKGIYAIGTHARMGANISVDANTNQIFNDITGNLYDVEYVVQTDQYGRPLDADGNLSEVSGKPSAYKTDSSGNKIIARDIMGNPIYKLDANGKKIATSDGKGGILQGRVDAGQVGYYIYGRSQNQDTDAKDQSGNVIGSDTHSSSITNGSKDLKVDSQGSTLFRVEAGAEFHGNGEVLSADAMNSILIVGAGPDRDRTGKLTNSGHYAQVNTNDAMLNLVGEGSIGVFINGGAQGIISDPSKVGDPSGTTLNLQGDRSIGGIVDGRYWTLFGSIYSDGSGNIIEYNGTNGTQQSKLTNYSNVVTNSTSGGDNVTGFVATNGGLIENHGYISLMNGENNTGIHILAHGELNNSVDDSSKGSSSIVIGSGTGIHVEGESLVTTAKIANIGNIEVLDGKAGLLLDNNAFLLWNSGGGINDKIIANGTAHGVLLSDKYTDWQGRQHGAAFGAMLGVNSIEVGKTAGSVGNGVENDAESHYIAFDNTVINVASKSSGIRTAASLVGEQFSIENGAVTYLKDALGNNKKSTVTINVTDDGVGYDFRSSDKNGGLSNILTEGVSITDGYTINVSGNATGIRTNTSATTVAGAVDKNATAYNEATVNIAAGSTGLGWLAGTANNVANAGAIRSLSADALLVDLNNRDRSAYGDTLGTNFYNLGTLEASAHDVLAVRGSKYDDNFYFTAPQSIVGEVDAGDGSDTLIWSEGTWNGSFSMGTGSKNTATIDSTKGLDFSNFYHAIGSTGDMDKLILANIGTKDTETPLRAGSFSADNLLQGINLGNQWENITLNNTNLELTGDIIFDNSGEFHIDQTSRVYAGNVGHRTVLGTNDATVYNAGAIDLTPSPVIDFTRTSDTFKDTFTINGSYVGLNGEIWLDTYLDTDKNSNDIAPSDKLVLVGGQASGKTALVINGYGEQGPGNLTYYDGIKVVDAQNGATTTDDAFYISPKSQTYQGTPDGRGAIMIHGSAYVYRLEKSSPGVTNPLVKTDVYSDDYWSNDWYLRSGPYNQPIQPETPVDPETPGNEPGTTPGVNPIPIPVPDHNKGPDPIAYYKSTVPLYEFYPAVIGMLERLPTLQQRLGNRQWIASPDDVSGNRGIRFAQSSDLTTSSSPKDLFTQGKNGLWFRLEGAYDRYDPRSSFTGSHSTFKYTNIQAGLDYRLSDEDKESAWFGGIEVHYKTGEMKVRGSKYGSGTIKPKGIGFGTTLTWYGQNRTYIDLQAAATFYRTDFTSDWTKLDGKDRARGYTVALSAEVGRSFELDNNWSLTPQAQVQWTQFNFNSFKDKMNAEVSLNRGAENLITRGGLALTKQEAWTTDEGEKRRYFAYGIANIYYEAKGTSKVNVSEVTVYNSPDRLSGGIGLGGSYNWNNDLYSIYGEVEARTSLNNFGDSYGYNGTVGFRYSF